MNRRTRRAQQLSASVERFTARYLVRRRETELSSASIVKFLSKEKRHSKRRAVSHLRENTPRARKFHTRRETSAPDKNVIEEKMETKKPLSK